LWENFARVWAEIKIDIRDKVIRRGQAEQRETSKGKHRIPLAKDIRGESPPSDASLMAHSTMVRGANDAEEIMEQGSLIAVEQPGTGADDLYAGTD